jgi:hypothetical protein
VGVPIEGTCDVERYQLTRIDSSTRHSRPMPVSVRTKGPSAPHAGAAPTPGEPQITDHWTSQCRGIVWPASPARPWRGCAGTAPPTKTRLAPAPLAGGFYSACVSGSIRHWN